MAEKKKRQGSVQRKTKETDIDLTLDVDGSGKTDIDSGVPFLDHMLTLFTVHGFFNLSIKREVLSFLPKSSIMRRITNTL